MSLVTSSGYAHVRLTVTDIERSVAFYDRVFGWEKAIDAREHQGEPGLEDAPEKFYGGVVYQTPQGTLFGLRPVGSQPFRSDVTGLDHVSFAVGSRADLDDAARGMEEAGIAHGDVIELADAGLAILSFQDPDDVNLELTAPLS
jgi:glyoxylase I family protein